MSYTVVNLSPEATYSAVNVRQMYDAIATAIGGQGWTLVDTVDIVVSTQTYRRWVWKAPIAVTGLPNDFHVIFEGRFTTTGTVWETNSSALRIWVCQDYDTSTNIGSKFITRASATSLTLNSDLTAPTSWDLDAVLPTTEPAIPLFYGLALLGTAPHAMQIVARPDYFFVTNGLNATTQYCHVYVGAMESGMSAVDDPMPVIMAYGGATSVAVTNYVTNATNSASLGQRVGFLTHPKLLPGGSYNYVFQGEYGASHQTGPGISGPIGFGDSTWNQNVALGSGAAPLWLGTSTVKVPVVTASNVTNGASRGGRRGYLKGMRTTGSIVSTGWDDRYTIDGAEYRSIYAGAGSTGTVIALLP